MYRVNTPKKTDKIQDVAVSFGFSPFLLDFSSRRFIILYLYISQYSQPKPTKSSNKLIRKAVSGFFVALPSSAHVMLISFAS